MPPLRAMRLRIRSVRSIAQVTRALEAVSAVNVRKARQAVLATRPYARRALDVLHHLSEQAGAATAGHPLLQGHGQASTILVVVFTSDRGLCGAYNINICRTALEFARQAGVPVKFIAIGRKGRDWLLRRGQTLIAEFSGLPAQPDFGCVAPVGRLVIEDFLGGVAGEVYLAYTEYVSTLRQEPVVRELLPLRPQAPAAQAAAGRSTVPPPVSLHGAYTYEPAPEELLAAIVPRFTTLQIYQALLEARASEYAARMMAMRAANDAAVKLLDELQLHYNKARQMAITGDMLDIVGGTAALESKLE